VSSGTTASTAPHSTIRSMWSSAGVVDKGVSAGLQGQLLRYAQAAASPDLHRSASWCVTLRSRVLSMRSTGSWDAARIFSTRDRTCDAFNRVSSLTLALELLQPRCPPRLLLQARLQLCPCHANSCDGVSCRCLVLRVRLCS
jgi:hypothetical protein